MSQGLDYQILMDNLISSSPFHQHLLDMLKLIPSELFISRHHHGSLRITKLLVLLGQLQQLLCKPLFRHACRRVPEADQLASMKGERVQARG